MRMARFSLLAALALALVLPAGAAAQLGSDAIRPTHIDWDLTTGQIATSCASEIARARRSVAALAAAKGPRTFRNTVLVFENINADLNDRLVAQTFLSQVAPDKAIRKTSLDCATAVDGFSSDVTADPGVYRAFVAAKKSGTATNVYDRALLDRWLQTLERSGAGLSPEKRADFVRLSKALTTVQNTFNENIANDKTRMSITKDEAAGLAPDFVASLKTTDEGYILPVNGSTNPQFLGNASNEDARKRYYYAYNNLQAEKNVSLLEQAIALRDQLAHILGFPSWAAYQLDVRVDRSPQHIQSFLRDLDVHLLPASRADISELARLKAQQTGDPAATIYLWDVSYYLNALQKSKYAVDQEAIRQYFPAPKTVDAIMALYQKILGVRFSPVTPANNWYPNVTEFAVSDTASGRFIGTFMLDLYPRDGKPGGAYNASVLPVRRMPNGSYRPPVSIIQVSDWPAPVNGKPALLTHDDVVTFFHEFGHNMAALLASTPYESLDQFQRDFVEAPSQMLENFVWDPTILKKISSNVDTGEPLPDELITKMIAARCVTDRLCNAYAATRQILLSIVDMDYHMSGPKVDTTAVWATVSRETTPLPMMAGTHPQAQFTHLVSGYDAGYYTYLWSLVYAQDMFTAFKKGGLENPAVGMRYRKTILAPARTYSPNVEVQNFLGRPMSTAAFYDGFKSAH